MKFNRLTIIKEDGVIWKDQRKAYLCKCDCGNYIRTVLKSLRSGNTKSCGCLEKEILQKRNFKHGHSIRGNTSKEYMVYSAMVARCTNPKNKSYKYYGGRGIKVGKEFLGAKGFLRYLKELGPKPKTKHRWTVGRINNDKGYCLGNIQWETFKQQANNTQRTLIINNLKLDEYVKRNKTTKSAVYSRRYRLKRRNTS